MNLPNLSLGEYELVYNMLSLAIAAMFGSFVFFTVAQKQLTYKYRPALIMSSLVVFIAGYHYWRIFNSWESAYTLIDGAYKPSGKPFNDAYRYVDWLLTVPLLVAELVAVLALSREVRTPMMFKLIIASVLMIGTGYPGEISADTTVRGVWGFVSTIPFVYILYILWVELNKATADASPRVKKLLGDTKLLLLATWGFYPIAYLMPQLGVAAGSATVSLQVGYSVADILAKCGYGFMIYAIAQAKMEAEGASPAEVAA
ncbi:MAG: xanthorhodopsin [Deltaproteobacteria bacterium]|nr:xanthorhodopsin [Deltaproteobacteria bacterium]